MQSPEVIRRAVQLLFDRGRYDQADEMIHKLQESDLGSSDPHDPETCGRGLTQVERPNPRTRAGTNRSLLIQRIIAITSGSARSSGSPGSSRRRPELRRAVELAGGEPAAWMVLVQYLVRTGQQPEAGPWLSGP